MSSVNPGHQPDPLSQAGLHSSDSQQINLLLAGDWEKPLWKRLAQDFRDRFAPEHLPPLHLTSRPIDVGMLQSDRLNTPWFRTVFTNVGDVISPENLPPLQLESAPEDVGELISDQMSHMWWTSLLRNLADRVAPERVPALQVTSKPMELRSESDLLQVPSWSATIDTPKVFLPDAPRPQFTLTLPATSPQPKVDSAQLEFVHTVEADLRRDLRRSVFRQRLWVSFAVLEVATLIGSLFFWK